GAPFTGRSGQLLTKMIQAMGLSRNQVYIANVVKCRPHLPQGVTGNRPPTEEEVAHCQPYLFSQIDLIKPQVIVALGERASHVLSGYKNDTSAGFRGSWKEFRGIPLMPTFSPSYLLDQDGPSGILEKRKAWEDLLAVMEKLRLPISQKQRSFFLTPS
ncbi:MAG: uracil-DNA glycosylase, partial [Verrucomicrobiota bacterium]|nr:uracil-DNA glycosylase [Verrucomicrobiota bacterium]